MATATARYSEISPTVTRAEFLTAIPKGSRYDLAIVACVSRARASVIRDLYMRAHAQNIVLEKFLFPRMREYDEAAAIFERAGASAWVNCPRRMMGDYHAIKNTFSGSVNISIRGGMWGLACNSVHFADLTVWLSGDGGFVFDARGLDRVIHNASRKGYVEFSGVLTGRYRRVNGAESHLSLEANALSSCFPLIHIMSEDTQALIDERNSSAVLWRKSTNWIPESAPLRIQFQSSLTNILAEEILEKGACRLASYRESAMTHKELLHAFTDFYTEMTGSANEIPIT